MKTKVYHPIIIKNDVQRIRPWQHGIKQIFYSKNRSKWWACAFCSMFFSLRHFGKKLHPEDLIKLVLTKKRVKQIKDGITIDDIKHVMKKYRILTFHKIIKNKFTEDVIQKLRQSTRRDLPILIFPRGHAIVLVYVDRNNFYFLEPDDNQKVISSMSYRDFEKYCFSGRSYTEALFLKP